MKDKKWKAEWKEEIIAAALLLGFAFFHKQRDRDKRALYG